MEITNMKYIWCPRCGTEARGFDEINERFGYRIKNRKEVEPYKKCKECRGVPEDGEKNNEQTNTRTSLITKQYTAKAWARKIHLEVANFENYLIELGYMEKSSVEVSSKCKYQLTEKGKEHSSVRTFLNRSKILWDFETVFEVLKASAASAVLLLKCPHCKNVLGKLGDNQDAPNSDNKCPHCGFLGKDRIVSLVQKQEKGA